MKQKTKLLVLISSFCFVFATCLLSVFAVQNISLNSGGTIKFIAPGIDATISAATLSGISQKTGSGTMDSFTVTPTMTTTQIEALSGYQSWSGLKLLFDDESEGNATISFTITNNSNKTTENIMVEISTNTTNVSPIQATPSADFCIAPNSSHTFEIILSVADSSNSALINDFEFTVAMNIIKPSEVLSIQEHSDNGLDIAVNSVSNTASFTQYENTTSQSNLALEIPSVVKDEFGNLYTITEIKGTSITDYPFASVKSTLSSVVIPSTITSIGDFAFYGCTALTGDLFIPGSITTIGKYAYSLCSGYKGSLIIPNNVISIGESAFAGCTGLTGDLIIPNSVTTLGKGAFDGCTKLNGELVLSNNLTQLEDKIFYNCTRLTGDIVIPDSVTSIGNYVFTSCSGFSGKLILGKSVISIGNYVFQNCRNLIGELIIPNSVTQIGIQAFNSCAGFTGNLIIPNNVTTIGRAAFSGCKGLTGSLTIGSGVQSIEPAAFACSFTSISVNAQNTVYYSKSNCIISKQDKVLVSGCDNSIIPQDENILKIGDSAFYSFSKFSNMELPYSLTTIGTQAFYQCGLAGALTIPANVTSIGDSAFGGCNRLTSIQVDGSNTAYYAIENCLISKKDKVLVAGCQNSKIPQNEGITKIGNNAFFNCETLTGDLEIPATVTVIGNAAFRYCSGFTGTLRIPANVTTIGNNAFAECINLSSIIVSATTPPKLGGTSCLENTNNVPIYVPSASVSAYQTATNWTQYASRIQAIS